MSVAHRPRAAAVRRESRLLRLAALLALAAALPSCGGGGGGGGDSGGTADKPAAPAPAPAPAAKTAPTEAVTVASGLDHPWSVAFLPDGRYLVTERAGRLRIVGTDGALRTVSGLPAVVAIDQGGLLDLALDPAFASNGRVYWSYAEADASGNNGLAVARGTLNLDSATMSNVQVVFRQTPKVSGTNAHYGGRIVFAPDGKLFVAMGERQTDSQRGFAQDLSRDHGKVARIEPDGGIPADNPFVGRSGARPEIWSLGHRNPQAATIHPTTGVLWTAEHGPQGGDEVNITRAGRNYGWPLISYGCEYDTPVGNCTPVGGATSGAGLEQPVTYWVPTSTAPSGMMIYAGSRFSGWQGKAFVGALAGQTLWQLDIDQSGPIVCTPPAGQSASRCREVALVKSLGRRIRDVRQGPDGYVYLLTDQGGGADRLLRLQ